jgi:hypothetical protein
MVLAYREWERGVSLRAYCGLNVGTTADHVIPRALFVVLDEQMITVPACDTCQQVKGTGERDLRNYCTMEIGASMHENMLELAQRMVDTNQATRDWLERVMATAREVILVDENDVEVGRMLEVDFNTDRMFETLKYIIKGLYWIDRGEALSTNCPIEVTSVPWTIFPQFMNRLGAHWRGDPIVRGNLVAWFSQINLATDDPQSTAWVLCINDGVGFYVATGTAALLERQRKAQRETVPTEAEQDPLEPRRVRAPRDPNGNLIVPPMD